MMHWQLLPWCLPSLYFDFDCHHMVLSFPKVVTTDQTCCFFPSCHSRPILQGYWNAPFLPLTNFIWCPCSASVPWVKDFRWRYFVWRSISCHHPFIVPRSTVTFQVQQEEECLSDAEPLTKMSLAPTILLELVAPTTVFSMSSSKSMYCSPSKGSCLNVTIWFMVKATVNLPILGSLVSLVHQEEDNTKTC